MHRIRRFLQASGAALILGCAAASATAAEPDETKELNELRNTVINLLQGLVDRGVITRDQAEQMVRDAQSKAAADAAVVAAQARAEESAVRVPYVPQVVKDEIRRQVELDLGEQVTKNVIEAAQSEGWGVPSALPEWVKRMRWYGDVRVRGQYDLFASDNVTSFYRDFQSINEAGGEARSGLAAFTNVTQDRERLRTRLRVGFETTLGNGWTMGARLATGSLTDPISTNQTLGSYGFRQQLGVDVAYLDWTGASHAGRQNFRVTGGRMRNPFFTATDLVYDQDLNFDGVASSWRVGLPRLDPSASSVFVNAGLFPLQEVELSGHDKWLVAGQVGLDWKYEGGSRTRVAVGFHRFVNTIGRRNAFDSDLLDFSAPAYLRQGNTVFDLRNDDDETTELYGLAADFDLLNLSIAHDWRVGEAHQVTMAADLVRNVGYSEARVLARTGVAVPERSEGFQAEVAFGSLQMARANAWRAAIGYRYLQRDAVIDAFTDSDFRLGGTDTKGYTLTFDYSITPSVLGRIRYMSASEIDGPPLGVDVLQLDLSANF